ncbi:hypothetical protein K431DRAFT_284873 [Polychaeton citri CBS 116435]|uniref:Uncharacterized protein n=1 Tax=Polychaeton citri CBS 116435 TaxID=1314669 RepID=A0A9P4UMP9_9PEZI|nr:hypothetical protein K431DRAFT_284873 [Polychaeton citri CBS 116435]
MIDGRMLAWQRRLATKESHASKRWEKARDGERRSDRISLLLLLSQGSALEFASYALLGCLFIVRYMEKIEGLMAISDRAVHGARSVLAPLGSIALPPPRLSAWLATATSILQNWLSYQGRSPSSPLYPAWGLLIQLRADFAGPTPWLPHSCNSFADAR